MDTMLALGRVHFYTCRFMHDKRHIVFLTLRGLSLLGLLVWVMLDLEGGRNAKLLWLFASAVLFWLCFSIFTDLIWPDTGHSSMFRNSAFVMIDAYIAVSFFLILHDGLITATVFVLLYCLFVTLFHGPMVGLVTAVAGALGAFNAAALEAVNGVFSLLVVSGGGICGAGIGFLVETVKNRRALSHEKQSKKSEESGKENIEIPVSTETREELLIKLKRMQENLEKVSQEREQLLEQLGVLEDKMKGGTDA